MKLCSLGMAAIALCGLAGCGADTPYPTVPVHGKITYEDGTPIPGHRVVAQFVPQVPPINKKDYPRPGWAELNADGTFEVVTTWKYADGVVPGPQKVLVKSLNKMEQPTGAVDPKYGTLDTPLKIEITAGGPPLALTVSKPSAAGNLPPIK